MKKDMIFGTVLTLLFLISITSVLADDWVSGTPYTIGDIITYNDIDYKVLQSHTSQPDWTPDSVSSLYEVVTDSAPDGVWQEGTFYSVDDVVYFDDVYYRSIQGHTAQADWTPDIVPALFEVLLKYQDGKPVINKENVEISYDDSFNPDIVKVLEGFDVEEDGSKITFSVDSKKYPELNRSSNIKVKTDIEDARLYKLVTENVTREVPIIENNETVGTEEITKEVTRRIFIEEPVYENGKYSFSVDGFSTYVLTQVGTISSSDLDGARGVFKDGNYVYVVSYISDSLTVIDVSTPTDPTQVGTISSSDLEGARGVFKDGNYAYVASVYDDSMTVIDVSDPTDPTQVGTISNSDLNGASSVYKDGDYVYVTSQGADSMTVIDVSDPTDPTQVGTISNSDLNGASSVYKDGDYVYVTSQGADSMTVIDVSDPTDPTQVGTISNSDLNGASSVYKDGDYVYVASRGADSMTVIDVSDSTDPTQVGTISSSDIDDPFGVYKDGDYVYVASFDSDSMTVIDVSDPTDPTQVDTISNTDLDGAYSIYKDGVYAYIASLNADSMTVIDVSGYNDIKYLSLNINSSRNETTDIDGTLEVEGEGNYTITDGSVETDIELNDTGANYNLSLYSLSESGRPYFNKTITNEFFSSSENTSTYSVDPYSQVTARDNESMSLLQNYTLVYDDVNYSPDYQKIFLPSFDESITINVSKEYYYDNVTTYDSFDDISVILEREPFKIRTYNRNTDEQIDTFDVEISAETYETNTSVVYTDYWLAETTDLTMYISATGYESKTITDYDVKTSGDLNTSLTPTSSGTGGDVYVTIEGEDEIYNESVSIGNCPETKQGQTNLWIMIFIFLILGIAGIALKIPGLLYFAGIFMLFMTLITGFCDDFRAYLTVFIGLIYLIIGSSIRI